MSSPVLAYRHDPDMFVTYTGNDLEYYPESGPVVVKQLHTARVEAYDLDALEIAADNRVVVTTGGVNKALEIGALGVVDPAVIDTTVIDSGTRKLTLASKSGVSFASDTVTFEADSAFRSEIVQPDKSQPTFHHVATPTDMTVGTGVLDIDDRIVSGAFLHTDADTFELRTDSSSIRSESGAFPRIRMDALHSHEFFVGAGAIGEPAGSGALEVLQDKIVIRKNVDIVGSIDSVATDSTSLQVEDQVIRLAHSSDPNTAHKDTLLEQGRTGLVIDTVPGEYSDDADYMSRFVTSDGTKLFVDDETDTIDVSKAQDSGLFLKEVAYHLNGGMKMAGEKSPTSRMNEPYWNMSGGALRLSHTVAAAPGRAKTYALAFRIVNNGTVEMVRITKNMVWNASAVKYVNDTEERDTSKVIMRYIDAPSGQ